MCCTSGIIGARLSQFLSSHKAASGGAKEIIQGGAVGRSGSSGKSDDQQDDAEELWFLNIPKDGNDGDVETKPKPKSKSKKKKKKKSTDEDGEEELYFVDVPSVV